MSRSRANPADDKPEPRSFTWPQLILGIALPVVMVALLTLGWALVFSAPLRERLAFFRIVGDLGGSLRLMGIFSLLAIWLLIAHTRSLLLRSRTETALRRARDDLERRVGERTTELAEAIATLQRDIAGRERAETALRESQHRYKELADSLPQIVFEADERGQLTFANRSALTAFGYTQEEFERGLNVIQMIVPEDRERAIEGIRTVLQGGRAEGNEYTALRRDGSTFPVMIYSNLILREGRPSGFRGIITDISERKRAEQRLLRQNDELAALYETTLGLINRLDPDSLLTAILDRATALMNASHAQILVVEDAQTLVVRAATGELAGSIGKRQKKGEGLAGVVWSTGRAIAGDDYQTWSGRLPDYTWIRGTANVPLYSGDTIIGVLGLAFSEAERIFGPDDIALLERFAPLASLTLENARLYAAAQQELAERKCVEEALRQSEENYRILFEDSPIALWEIDFSALKAELDRLRAGGVADVRAHLRRDSEAVRQLAALVRVVAVNRATLELYGARNGEQLLAAVRSIDQGGARLEGFIAEAAAVAEGLTHFEIERESETLTGERKNIVIRSSVVPGYEQTFAKVLVSMMDVTEHRRLEEQLRQAQKMEAVGRLAGGIAHDFNNLLTVINGYSQMLLGVLEPSNPVRADIQEILCAGERAASLTRQLLAFSRRQIMEPRVLNLNEVWQGMSEMLQRIIGEDVRVECKLAPDLGSIKADAGQVEQVVLNLVVNARDAMPSGGVLTVETANVYLDEAYAAGHLEAEPGRYVMLAVADTGVGMTLEVQEHLFEPFFTTKEVGQGTGLGLATVYGIVKQCGGAIEVQSKPGQGSMFRVYLPRVDEQLSAPTEVLAGNPPQGRESVLVVEDQEDVRRLAVRMLQGLGYHVLKAASGSEALELMRHSTTPLHLVLTDVVMPEMSGPAFVAKLRQMRQGFKVLLMSGYSGGAIAAPEGWEPGTPFIQKPFTREALARKVREILETSRE